VLALGIDVGASRKGLDVVLLDESRRPGRVASKVAIERLGMLIADVHPDVIAIDAPPVWAPNGSSRLTERLLAEVNIHAFNTPAARDGHGHPFYAWMEVGFEVFKVAAGRGYPRYRAGAPRGTDAFAGAARERHVRAARHRDHVLERQWLAHRYRHGGKATRSYTRAPGGLPSCSRVVTSGCARSSARICLACTSSSTTTWS
jgi:hypothetical protein